VKRGKIADRMLLNLLARAKREKGLLYFPTKLLGVGKYREKEKTALSQSATFSGAEE